MNDPLIDGKTITLTPYVGVGAARAVADHTAHGMQAITEWVCLKGTMDNKYLPGSCK
jgi:hypothetical protein